MYPSDQRVTKEDKVIDAVKTLLYLGEEEEDGNGLSKFWVGKTKEDGSNSYYNLMYRAMSFILEAERTRTFFTGMEKGSRVTKLIKTETELLESYIYGGLRRMGQGADPAGVAMRESKLEMMESGGMDDEDHISPLSLFAALDKSKASETMHNPWLKEMLDNGVYIHNNVSSYIFKAAQQDMINDQYSNK
jgi:hypothetical protein